MRPRIGVAERRARLALRHHLACPAPPGGETQVAGALVGLHATDPATVFLAAAARMPEASVEAMERALYEERSLAKILCMRRTMFVVPADLVPVVHAACTRALVPRQRRLLVQHLEQAGVAADGAAWLLRVEEATFAALAARGEAFAAELSDDVPDLRAKLWFKEGVQGVSTRVLLLLAAEGRIVRGRPRGSWTSSLYRWTPVEPAVRAAATGLPTAIAQVELVRRWLAAFGPGTEADLRWWTGLTAREVGHALAGLEPVEVELDGRTGLVLHGDLEPVPAPEPWVGLLPALDPTVMGWTERGWYLGAHGPALFDRSGNAGPTVWWDGRIVGGWAQRKDGEIAYRLLEDVGAEAVSAVEAAAERLRRWLGPARVTPRFRTPLERELVA